MQDTAEQREKKNYCLLEVEALQDLSRAKGYYDTIFECEEEKLTVSRSCIRGGNRDGYEKLSCS